MRPLLFVLFALGELTFSPLQAQELIDLGDLGGDHSSFANAVNDSSVVVGDASTSSYYDYPFVDSNGVMSTITTSGVTGGSALAVNSSGQVAGYFNVSNGNEEPFLDSNGSVVILNPYGNASGINDVGTVVGTAGNVITGPTYAFSYSDGTLTNLGTLNGDTSSGANGINQSGEIVGYSTDSSGAQAFVYSKGTMTGLGVLPGYSGSDAVSINNSGQIAGYLDKSSRASSLFLYSGGVMTDLGTLPGYDTVLNAFIANNGDIVGGNYSSTAPQNPPPYAAYIFIPGDGLQNLNTLYSSLLVSGTGSQPGFTNLMIAGAMNDQGDIVGVGAYWTGDTGTNATTEYEAFLLDPASVPESPIWIYFGINLLLLAAARRGSGQNGFGRVVTKK